MKRVVVVGLGSIAERHRSNLKLLFPSAEIIAVSASGRVVDEKVSHADAISPNLSTLLDLKIDLAIVASPASHHIKHAVTLLNAGIPTLIEKPLALSAESAKQLMVIQETIQTPVAVGYCLRYQPSAQYVQRYLKQGLLGTLYNASIEVGHYLPDWRPGKNYRESVSANRSLGGGALLELSHELDYAQWMLGELIVHHAHLRSSTELALDVEDQADIVATNKQGTHVYIHLDFLQRKPHRNARFSGAEGVLEWDLISNRVTLTTKEKVKVLFDDPKWDKNQMYIDMLKDFKRKVEGRKCQAATVAESEKTLQIIDQIKDRYPVTAPR